MFLAVLDLPPGADAVARAAAATGQAAADVRQRLAGVLPRVLAVNADPAPLERSRAALEADGFGALTFDPLRAPSDDARLVARALVLRPGELEVVTGRGAGETRHVLPADAIELLQRGVRDSTRTVTSTSVERKVSIGRAVATGGLKVSKKVETTTRETTGAREPFLLLQRRDGGPEVVLYEPRLDFRFLGAELGPVSHANFARAIERICALAPAAPLDDRVTRPGWVSSIPRCAADPLDVALHLVLLARRAAPP